MTTYPFDWYWRLGDGRIWSSAQRRYVPADDERFSDWIALGNPLTVVPTADQVGEALQRIGSAHLAPPCAASLQAECARRILAVLKDEVTQINLTSYAAGLLARKLEGPLPEPDEAALDLAEAARRWVTDMRTACRGMIVAGETEFRDDARWPPAPAGLVELVKLL